MSKTFCILPWIHITASPSGFYKPCCNTHKYFEKEFTADKISMQEAFYSEHFNQLRQDLLDGKKPDICHVCWHKEELGIPSYRQAYNSREVFNEILDLENPSLKYIDVKFDNNCNLQCSYCDISSSNQFEKARDFFDKHGLEHPNNLDAKKDFYSDKKEQYIIELAKSLRVLKVTGGEPLLSKNFINVLNHLIDNDYARNIELHLTTNGTKFNKTLLSKLNSFQKVVITISIDSVGNLYDYIRYPFNWKKFNERVYEILGYAADKNKFKIKFAAIVTAYSILDTVPVFEWTRQLEKDFDLTPGALLSKFDFNVSIYPLDHPLSVFALPQEILDLAKQKVDQYKEKEFLESTVIDVFGKLKTDVNLKTKISLKRFTQLYDMQRNTDHTKVLHPIIIDYINRS